MAQQFQAGDPVIYRMPKHSSRPGPRAQDVRPAPHGEDYAYHVDKFWMVAEVLPDGRLVAQTRRGKRHVVHADDPALRPAGWLERLLHRKRFPTLHDCDSAVGCGGGGPSCSC